MFYFYDDRRYQFVWRDKNCSNFTVISTIGMQLDGIAARVIRNPKMKPLLHKGRKP